MPAGVRLVALIAGADGLSPTELQCLKAVVGPYLSEKEVLALVDSIPHEALDIKAEIEKIRTQVRLGEELLFGRDYTQGLMFMRYALGLSIFVAMADGFGDAERAEAMQAAELLQLEPCFVTYVEEIAQIEQDLLRRCRVLTLQDPYDCPLK